MRRALSISLLLAASFFPASSAVGQSAGAPSGAGPETYQRVKDPTWYRKQLAPLIAERDQVDAELRRIRGALARARGGTNAVRLDQDADTASPTAQIGWLERRRTGILRQMEEIKDLAQRNGILPGELRAAEGAAAADSAELTLTAEELEDPVLVRAWAALLAEKEHLDRARRELDLLERDHSLLAQQFYASPSYSRDTAGRARLDGAQRQIEAKRGEVQDTLAAIGRLEEKLENLRRELATQRAADPGSGLTARTAPEAAPGPASEPAESAEAQWRKRFAEARYKLQVTEKELDVLRREWSLLLVQYYLDPNKAMREQYNRRDLNNHATAIAEKKMEVERLRQALSDLEDDLRRAGGYPGWAR